VWCRSTGRRRRRPEQAVDDCEQGVGLREGPVGETDLESVTRMPLAMAGARESERRLDQRGIRLDVRAHHQDVAWLERGIVGEQPEDHLTQHLDLTSGAVAGMHLDAAIGGLEDSTARLGEGIGGEIVLEPPEQGVRALGDGTDRVVDVEERRERALQLADVATQRREQGMVNPLVGGVAAARHGAGEVDQGIPLRLGRMRQPDVDVTVLAEGAEQLGLGDGDPGVAEEREPRRQGLGALTVTE
jgi:hypothetical protein